MTIALLPLEASLTGTGNTQPITAALLGIATVGILTALGAMVGKILADSGGSDAIVETLVGRSGTRMLVDAGRFGDRGLGQRVGHLPAAPGVAGGGGGPPGDRLHHRRDHHREAQTIRSWSVMETAISVVGIGLVLLLDLVV